MFIGRVYVKFFENKKHYPLSGIRGGVNVKKSEISVLLLIMIKNLEKLPRNRHL